MTFMLDAMSDTIHNLKIQIIKYISDEPQPGIVACQFVDANGRNWCFIDKIYIFTEIDLRLEMKYPINGAIRGMILGKSNDINGSEAFIFDIELPDHVESIEGVTRFLVTSDQVSIFQ